MRQIFKTSFKFVFTTLLLTSAHGFAASERDHIGIVGSSTVYPFATAVADSFSKATGFKKPSIESIGTGAGFQQFCAGVGAQYPDISNASRPMKPGEKETCANNGVTEIVEVKIGYDGVTITNSKWVQQLKFTTKELFLALAKQVPDPSGAERTVANPYKTWRNVNPKLPGSRIQVFGPPTTSGTRDTFLEQVMEPGCRQFAWLRALEKTDPKAFKGICHTLREDGGYVNAGENDNLIVTKLIANPKIIGIFGFSFLDQNMDKLQGSAINGVVPEYETIANGSYPVSRPLFIYVKKAHIGKVAGLEEFLAEFTSEKAWGRRGYLSDLGLIPMPDTERAKFSATAKNLEVMN